jgi:glucose-6-phosphate dehydrogenase assembly protein OpcA
VLIAQQRKHESQTNRKVLKYISSSEPNSGQQLCITKVSFTRALTAQHQMTESGCLTTDNRFKNDRQAYKALYEALKHRQIRYRGAAEAYTAAAAAAAEE